jgi:hypothetical protein
MSIGYLSQNGVNKMFGQFSEADPNLNQYGFGQLYNQNGEPKVDQKYKGMWVNPVQSFVNEYTVDRTYQILIYDVVYEDDDGTSQNKIISDCEEIAFRLIRFLRNKSDIFDLTQSPTVQPFTDRFLDNVSGVIIDITIEFNGESAICEDPNYDFNITQNNLD